MISALLTHTSPPGITYLHFFGWNWYILIGDEQVLAASSLSLIIKHWFLITLSKMTPWYWHPVVSDQKGLPTIFCFHLDTLENKSLPKFKWVHVQEFELCVFLREVTVSCPRYFVFVRVLDSDTSLGLAIISILQTPSLRTWFWIYIHFFSALNCIAFYI